ncbi:MAG: hypothetical protein L6420_11780, partial [Elusimicrobia bacterium]|nr:hypothetical protein [Elusimicrobiota bacterium]
MKKSIVIILAAIAALAFTSRASANMYDEKYYTIDKSSIKLEPLEEKGGSLYHGPDIPLDEGTDNNAFPSNPSFPELPGGPAINPPMNGSAVDEHLGTIDKIVNLMEKAFGIIEKNKPVVNITTNYANAVPYGTSHWTQLQGWSKPGTRKYAFSMKNLYGGEVVKVIYQVHWTYGGNLAGKGKFLTGVTVEPIRITAGWGYTVDLTAAVPDSTVANVGTSEDPIASMQVQLNWRISTITKVVNEKAIYYIQGDGFMQELASPFSKERTEAKTRKQILATDKLI